MSERNKKKLAPIIVTILFVLYYIVYFGIIMTYLSGIVKLLFGVIPALLSGVMIYVCVQRMKEIEGGEEDDLSQY